MTMTVTKTDKMRLVESAFREPLETLLPRLLASEGGVRGVAAVFSQRTGLTIWHSAVHRWCVALGVRLDGKSSG